MELRILGAGYGFPGICTMLACGGSLYLIDAGIPVAEWMHREGISFDALRAVFLTHRHGDHTVGLANLAHLTNGGYKKTPLEIWCPEECCLTGLKAYLLSMKDAIQSSRLQLHLFEAGCFYKDENITVTAIATDHINGQHPAYGFLIEGEGKKILFTGDLHRQDPYDFPREAASIHTQGIICEMEHFHTADLLPYLKTCQTEQLFFHHYNAPWSLGEIRQLQEANILPYPVKLLRDGDRISL